MLIFVISDVYDEIFNQIRGTRIIIAKMCVLSHGSSSNNWEVLIMCVTTRQCLLRPHLLLLKQHEKLFIEHYKQN